MAGPAQQLDPDAVAAANAVDAQVPKTAPAAQPVAGQAETPQVDPDANAAATQVDQFQGVPGSGTPDDPYKGLIDFSHKVQEAYQVGQSSIRESALGSSVAAGSMTLEDAQKRIDQDEQAKWQSADVAKYEKQNWSNWAQGLLVSGTMEGAKSLPQMAASFQQQPAPEDYAIGGAAIAGFLQPAKWTAHYIFGQDYLRRRQLGAPHDEAVKYAAANAMGQGIIQALSMLPVGGVALNAAKIPIAAAKPLLVKALMGVASHAWGATKFTAAQEGLQLVNEIVQKSTDAIEATVSDRPNMMPTLEQAAKEFGENFVKTLGVSAIMHTTATGAGLGLRSVLKQTAAAVDLHLQAQQAKLAKIEEQRAIIRDQLKGHVEEDTELPEQTEAEKERARILAVFQEQKDRLAKQEAEITKLDGKISKAHRQGYTEEADLLGAERQKLMDDTKVLSEIVEAEEKTRHAEATKRLNKIVKQTIPTATQGSKVERGSEPLQEALDLARHFVQNPQDAKAILEEEAAAKTPDEKAALPGGMTSDIAQLVGDIREKDSEQLNELADQLELAYGLGRKGRVAQIIKRNETRNARVAVVKEGITYKGEVSDSVNRQKTPAITLAGSLRNGVIGMLGNWKQAWYMAFRGNPNWEAFYDEFLDPGRIIDAVGKGTREWHDKKFEILADHTGKTRAQVVDLQRMGRRKNQITFTADNGDHIGLTAMEAVKLLGEARNDKLKSRFIGANKFGEDFENIISNQLDAIDPAYRKMVDGYEEFYAAYRPDLAATVLKDKGVPMATEDHYAGYVSAVRNEEIDRNAFTAQLEKGTSFTTKTKAQPSFVKKRTSSGAIAPQDAESAARAHIALGERYKTWLEPSKEIYGPILRDRSTRTMIRNKAGAIAMKALDSGYDYMINGSAKDEVKWGNFVDHLFSSLRFNTMANNWLYLPEHFASGVAGAQYIPIYDYLRGQADFYHNPFKLVAKINNITKNSDIWKQRYEDIEQVESGSSLPKIAQNPEMPKIVNDIAVGYHKFGMASITYGSMSQVMPMMHSIYTYWKRQGLSDSEAMYKAGIAAENVATSMRPDLTSNFSHLPGGNYALMFQQQVNKFGVDQLIAADNFLASPSKATLTNFVKTQAITGLASAVFPLIRETYNYLIDPDQDKKDDAVFRMNMALYHILLPGSSMFGAGQATDSLMTAYHNAVEGTKTPVYDFSIPALELITNSEKFFGSLMDNWINGKWEPDDRKKMGAQFLKGPGSVVPLGLKAPAGFVDKVTDK